MAKMTINQEASSFRDPSGFIFSINDEIYRQINKTYQEDYELIISSGLYERITKKRKLVSHDEVDIESPEPDLLYKIVKPEKIKFISYPYEWSFSQLKDAALLTLNLQKEALSSGMILKDASAYNIQFQDGHPILIDTLSFAKYSEGKPWVAYKQFCQHFLSPLVLMAYKDIRLNELLINNIDGIPLDLASKLLPFSSWLNFGILSHIHLHARAQKTINNDRNPVNHDSNQISKTSLLGLIENLEKTVSKLRWNSSKTDWNEYYQATNYSEPAFLLKQEILKKVLLDKQPHSIVDLGANTGLFSRLAKDLDNCQIISCDFDPGAVEINYLQVKKDKEKNILPLVIDITNPSPSIGWQNKERISFNNRVHVDLALVLALIHHLAISNNIPLSKIAQYLSGLAKTIIIEFVPKTDSQVKRLLATRDDIFMDYTLDGFIKAFEKYFLIFEKIQINETDRTLFIMEKKE